MISSKRRQRFRRAQAGLTPGQRNLLVFIADFIGTKGYSPSFIEMRDGMCLASTGAVASLIGGLEERGHLSRLPGRHRSIALTNVPPSLIERSVSHETSQRSAPEAT
jgi:SOS-response transcriptional repressor LexA